MASGLSLSCTRFMVDFVSKLSGMGQPSTPTQPFVPMESKINVFTWITEVETIKIGRLGPRTAVWLQAKVHNMAVALGCA